MRLLPLPLLGEVSMECSTKLDDMFEDIEPISCCRLNTPFFLEKNSLKISEAMIISCPGEI